MGTLKICIDAGHYGNYNNNTHVSPTYWESRMAWKLHMMQKEELEKYEGVTVILTRTDVEKDLDVVSRGKKAKGCDLFISDHSNSCDTESVDRPVVIYPVSGLKEPLAAKLAATIRQVMQTKDPERIYNKWNSAHNADYYGVIRGAASVGVPGLILEHSFHSNDRAAQWLSSDANLRKLAQAEVAILAEEYGLVLKGSVIQCPFTDVKRDSFYYDSVMWAVENDIVQGLTDTTFGPNKPCTRAQIVTILHRYHQKFGGG